MSGTPDLLTHLGGAPVASASRFSGWWNNKFYFVDYDNGTVGADGQEMHAPTKTLAVAIANADKWDVIYIRPRDPDTDAGDSNYHIPASATNWSIPAAKHGMSLIGTGLGMNGHGMAYQTYLRGHGSVTTGSTLDVAAPFCSIENLAFHRGGGNTTGMVKFSDVAGTNSAFGSSISNCLFRFAAGTWWGDAALVIEDSWYVMIFDNTFYRNATGIGLYANHSSCRAVQIVNNTFEGLVADVGAHINSNGTLAYCKIAHNYFIDDKPTDSPAKYIFVEGSGSTGGIFDNYFGTASTTTTTLITAGGLKEAGNYAEGQLIT